MQNEKTFVVIGACGLLGRSITRQLLETGHRVAALDIDEASLSKHAADTDRERFLGLKVDAGNKDSIQQALDAADTRFGPLDGAVNCTYPRGRNYGRHLFEIEHEDFTNNVSLHLGAYFLFMQQCALYAKRSGRGFALVNLSSVYGSIAPRFEIYEGTSMTMPAEYAAIKAGLQHLSKYVAAYMKGTQFRVNCVAPGGILDKQPESFLSKYRQHCTSKGMLDADDVVGAVTFLLSDESRFINGQVITVDDGFTL